MSKRPPLSEALQSADAAASPPAEAKPAPKADRPRRDREGRRMVSGWFPVEMTLELEELRLERSRALGRKVTLQELQEEGYNDLFKKYRKAELAKWSPSL